MFFTLALSFEYRNDAVKLFLMSLTCVEFAILPCFELTMKFNFRDLDAIMKVITSSHVDIIKEELLKRFSWLNR